MPGLYSISSNTANVAVSNTPGLYIGSGASSILNNAQQLLTLLSNSGNVNFALASGNSTVLAYFTGNIDGSYSNVNVAAYLPTYTGSLNNSATILALNANLGAFETYANATFGTSTYGNSNVAAYLPTYGGTINVLNITGVVGQDITLEPDGPNNVNINADTMRVGDNNQDFTLVTHGTGNLQLRTHSGSAVEGNITLMHGVNGNIKLFPNGTGIVEIAGNTKANYFLGDGSQLINLPVQAGTYSNTNVAAYLPTYTGTLAQSSTIIDLYSNAATQATAINAIDANLGAFETYANATFGTSSYGNVQAAAFLTTYSGNIGNVDIKTGSQNWYGGTMTIQANAATAAGGTLNLKAGNVSNSVGGTVNVQAANITLGGDYYATDLLQINMPMRVNYTQAGVTTLPNVAVFQQGNVLIDNRSSVSGNRSNFGGYLFVDNTVRAGSFVGDGSQLSNIPAGNVLGVATSQTQILGGNLTANVGFTTNLYVKDNTLNSSNGYSQILQNAYSYANGNGGTIDLTTRSVAGSAFSRITITADSDGVNAGQVFIAAAGASGIVRLTAGNIDIKGNLTANANVSTTGFFVGDGRYLTNIPSSYGNTQVAAYLPTYTGTLTQSSTIIDLYSNAATQATSINTITANIGAFQTFSNANAATQATSIDTITANLGAFQTYANATFGTSTYGNAQVLANLAANSTQTSAWSMPFGGNSARPAAPIHGMFRYNTDRELPEWYSNIGNVWVPFSTVAPSSASTYNMWYLAVGGGGSGGTRIGAGGGAGGLLTGNVSITTGQSYTITVGAGGASVASTPGNTGNDGGNTVVSGTGISTITAIGGGGGGAYIGTNGTAGRNGGSGGGGSYSGNGGVNTAGSGTSGQGSAGGAGSATNVSGGGGGGASAAGQAAQASAGGAGGAGTASTITGASVTYAGGGGGSQASTGGAGGSGGGGAGSSGNADATAGTNYLGGGGGGARNDSDTTGVDSGKGGDGVCIIRVANVNYSGSYTGSNVAISYSGGDTILKFSASGTYTG